METSGPLVTLNLVFLKKPLLKITTKMNSLQFKKRDLIMTPFPVSRSLRL